MKKTTLTHLFPSLPEDPAATTAILECFEKHTAYLLGVKAFTVTQDPTSPIPVYIVVPAQANRYHALLAAVERGWVLYSQPISYELLKANRSPRRRRLAA